MYKEKKFKLNIVNNFNQSKDSQKENQINLSSIQQDLRIKQQTNDDNDEDKNIIINSSSKEEQSNDDNDDKNTTINSSYKEEDSQICIVQTENDYFVVSPFSLQW